MEEPPRHAPDTIGYQSVAGYNPARSDFEIEYDAGCEDVLAKINETDLDENDPNYAILVELQLCLVRSYNWRLRQREKRKRIVRNHGLILMRKTTSSLHRYEATITRPVAERLLNYMQFMTGTEFDFFIEGLHRAAELKHRIAK